MIPIHVIDYQHGIIFDGHDRYVKDGNPPKVKSENNICTFVHGDIYKKLLIDGDKSRFYSNENVINVGLKRNCVIKMSHHLIIRKYFFFTGSS